VREKYCWLVDKPWFKQTSEQAERKYATLKYIGVHKGTTLFAFLHGKIDLMH